MIKGLSQRRRLPRLGKIKLGVMRQAASGKMYPAATDYFVCPEAVQKLYGPTPKELPVMLPVDDPEGIFPQELKMYRASGLFCKGDGETASRWTERGELQEMTCPCPFLESGDCAPVATLNLLLPDVPGVGVWQLSTSNKRSIVSINTALETFSKMFGGLRGVPFTLKLEPEQIQRFDERSQKMVAQTLQVVRLDSPYTMRQIVEWREKAGKPVEALMPKPDADEADARAEVPTENDEAPASQGGKPAADGAPLTRAGAGSSPAPPASADLGAEWDISMCFAGAKKLGVDAADYTNYLLGVYATDVDNLPSKALTDQRGLIEEALRAPHTAEQLGKTMKIVAKKIERRNDKRNGSQQRLA